MKRTRTSVSTTSFMFSARISGSVNPPLSCFFFFFNDTATTEIYTLSLHDALPIPSAPKLTHGSVTRGRSPAGGAPPAQSDQGRKNGPPQLKPPSAETAVPRARAPPSDQRSCCQFATVLPVTGSTATWGSTSAFVLTTPPCVAPIAQAENGLGPVRSEERRVGKECRSRWS